MKFNTLRKQLIVEGAILGGVAVAFTAVMLVISGVESSKLETKSQVSNEIRSIESNTLDLESRMGKAQSSLLLYQALKENRENETFDIDRDKIAELMQVMRKRFRLSSLQMTVAPEREIENEKLQKKTMRVISSDVQLQFGGMSDTHLYSFIDAMNQELSGFVKTKKLNMQRIKAIDESVLLQMRNGANPEMVSAVMDFTWVGLQNLAPQPDTGDENAQ